MPEKCALLTRFAVVVLVSEFCNPIAVAARKIYSTPPLSAILYEAANKIDPIKNKIRMDDAFISNAVGFGLTRPAIKDPVK